MQRIDIIVEARMTSKRLPGKVALEILGRPILDLMIERLKKIKNANNIIIATTKNSIDDKIEKIATNNNVLCFRGSENDVLKRVLLAAEKNKTDIIVEITGDNPLIDFKISNKIIEFFISNQNKYDYVSNDAALYNNNFGASCIIGFNTKVFTSKILKKVDSLTDHPTDREHVVNFILNNEDIFKIHNYESEEKFNRKDIRLTLDYPEDYQIIKKIFEELYPLNNDFSAGDIIEYLDKNPKVKNINKNCVQQKYKY